MKTRTLAGIALLLSSPLLLANEYRCVQGELVRRIQIVYEPGKAVPCEVHYFKDTEAPGTDEVLWTAQNKSGYCEARTNELLAKLQSSGWTCDPVGDTPAADDEPAADELVEQEPADQADDTSALSPVDEQ